MRYPVTMQQHRVEGEIFSSCIILIIIEEALSRRCWQNSLISLDKLVSCAHVGTNHSQRNQYRMIAFYQLRFTLWDWVWGYPLLTSWLEIAGQMPGEKMRNGWKVMIIGWAAKSVSWHAVICQVRYFPVLSFVIQFPTWHSSKSSWVRWLFHICILSA